MLVKYTKRTSRRIAVLVLTTLSLGVAAVPSSVGAAPVAPLAAGDPSLTLSSGGSPASSLAVSDTLRSVTDAPITLTGQTSQTIEQTWDSSQLRLGSDAVTSPEGWQLEYTTDGTTWSSSAPSDMTTVTGVRSTGVANALGYTGGLQAFTTASDGAVRVPTVSSISVTGLGDGWDVFFDESYTKVFNVFHHSSPSQIDCHSLFDGSRCTGYPVSMPSSLGTNNRSTGIVVGSKVWVASGRSSNPGGGFSCFNVSGGLCSTSFVKLSSNVLSGSHSNVVNMARVGQYVFTQNRSDGKVLCLDTTTSAGCAAMPAGGFSMGHGASSDYNSNLLAVGSRVYSHTLGVVGCLDTATWNNCSGWDTAWTSSRNYQLMALPDASGAIVAVCTFNDSGADCVDNAQQAYTHPTSFNTTLGLSPAAIAGYGKTPETSGTRVYWSDANYTSANGEISCWDASLNAGAGGTCANFPLRDENYTVVVDPQNADCIWTNDNNGSIEAFDVTTGNAGCPVDTDPVVQLPYTSTVPRLACAEEGRVRAWTLFKATVPSGVSASDLRVTVKRSGLKVSGWENLTPDVNGEIDLSSLSVSQTGTQPMFEVKVVGASTQDADLLTADLTFVSDAPQMCTDLVVLKECPAGSGIAPAGAFAVGPVSVDSSVTNVAPTATSTAPLSESATRAAVSNCQGALAGTVLRTPPGGSFPIVGATVTLRDGSGNTVDTTTTDGTGAYSFPSLYSGAYTVSYTSTTQNVSIVSAATTTENFSIPVGNPVAEDVAATTAQNVPVTLDPDATADPLTSIDSSSLQIRLGSGAWGSSVAVPSEGTWSIVADQIVFTPVATFHGSASTIEYRVMDMYGNVVTANADVTVSESAPVATADSASGIQGVSLGLDAAASAGAVAIDYSSVELASDVSGSYSAVLTVAGVGTFTPDSSGHVVFVPAGSFTGSHTVSYRVADAVGRYATSTFTVSLTPVALAGSSDIVPPSVDGSLPVTGIPSGALVSVPFSLANVKSLSFSNGSVLIEPVAGFSGIIRVPVSATLGTATFTTEVVLTVLPKAPATVKISNTTSGARITWPASETLNATGYVVRVNGIVICSVSATNRTCSYPGLLGPRPRVDVQTLGADDTVSGFTLGVPSAKKCQKIGSVRFATDSARLTESAKRELRAIAAEMKAQRFTGYCLSGHTDSRGSFSDNDSLSYYRARAVSAYLNQRLPASMRLKVAYSGEYRPTKSNKSSEGMASNRRVDIAVN